MSAWLFLVNSAKPNTGESEEIIYFSMLVFLIGFEMFSPFLRRQIIQVSVYLSLAMISKHDFLFHSSKQRSNETKSRWIECLFMKEMPLCVGGLVGTHEHSIRLKIVQQKSSVFCTRKPLETTVVSSYVGAIQFDIILHHIEANLIHTCDSRRKRKNIWELLKWKILSVFILKIFFDLFWEKVSRFFNKLICGCKRKCFFFRINFCVYVAYFCQ